MTPEEKKAYCLSMARTIWKSIFCSATPPAVLSWGISRHIATWYNDMPALELRVQGMLYTGRVVTAYNEGSDYFEVYFLDADGRCTFQKTDICFDELGVLLDEHIERPAGMSDKDYHAKSMTKSVQALIGA